MKRSAEWTRIIKRSKGACSIALIVTLVCAIFGVGGAAAGDGSYARHLREARVEARLAGAALAHRSPQQLLLAVTPQTHSAPAATTTTPATTATTPAATVTTTATTDPAPAATTPASTTSDATPGPATPAGTDGGTANLPTGTGSNPTDTTTGNGATTTGTTTTGTTGTTTTGTTTTGATGTTTTTTTTTGTTPTNPPSNAAGLGTTGTTTGTTGITTGTGTNAATGAGHVPGSSGSGSTTPECHGRCSGLGQSGTSGVVPTSVPSAATSPATSTGFNLGVSPIPSTASSTATSTATSTPISAVSTSGSLNPTSTPTTSTSTSSTSGNSGTSTLTPLTSLPILSSSALRKVTQGATQHGHSSPAAGAGTGGATTGALARHPTAPTGGTTAARTSGTTSSHKPTTPRHKPKSQNSGGSTPLAPAVKVIDQVVKVIPTALWIALAAAFGLALVCAAVALRSGRRARRREREFAAISAAAQTDPLTGILNRRGFMDAADRELARASRYDRPFVLAYVDVRGLKAVNDTEGHLMGDELIKTVAGLMKESARADDVVGRIGGDEFALLLGEQTGEGAEPVVRRIRARVAERRAAMEIGMPWELTIGLAAFPQDGTTLEELLGVADRRLYEQRGIALR